jgi:acetylornithine deacetylase/succinyl-diaminopimelate desuccinylase family protein
MPIPSAVELLRELVRRPSINPMGRTDLPSDLIHEARVTDYLESQLQLLGVRYERHEVQPGRANLVAFHTPPEARGCVLWEAHQDTVPVDGMTIDPFAGEVRDGRLYGRGACDVKGGAVAMLAAFAQLVELNTPGSMSVILAFTIDEEHTFLGAQHLVSLGLKPDYAIVAEPTGLNIVNAHKGVVRWAIETHGIAVHSSRPEQGVSAIYRMTPILAALETYAAELRLRTSHPQLGAPSLSVGMIHGGVSPNTVPDFCRIEIDRRLNPGETAATAIAEVQKYLSERVPTPFMMLPAVFACSPLTGELSGPLVTKLGMAIDAITGSHTVDAVPYGTDASTLAEAGIPVVVFGPGSIEQAHTKDEYLELTQLDQAIQILVHFAINAA